MQKLIQFLREVDDDAQMERKLNALLTPNEMSEMQHRLQIFELLRQGMTQREIAKQLGVGIATVTRGSRAFKELQEDDSL
ncbi:Trp family transcriptional regulator [Marinomonas mediterranea]|uniref:Trp family transcriptional regulator n=1 Tax=Marinomonas mediterranea TaxID=119864 RepID=UPI002349D8FC|nr:Trp family transcriptional regulator [Marinomonas mediterranea]WCN10706.1 helix-turn-helix domain-containing protein [Marinomonas mediterranea]WCN14763.1 helix-turn-helix domain-containing protein [Marinomonas mediterranea]